MNRAGKARPRGAGRVLAQGLCASAALWMALAAAPSSQATAGDWQLVVLGIAQDGGIPQLGCASPVCREIRAGRRKAEKVSSLGLVNRRTGAAYLFDATPDLPAQLQRLTGGRPPSAIFLTHAHIGHYTGLMFLGRESVSTFNLPVYATERMGAFLRANGPWSQLVAIDNIALKTLRYDEAVELDAGVRVTAFRVPHRDEYSDTVGFRIDGPRRSALFVPDIDRWEKWDRNIRTLANAVDYAFLDGTFASAAEINRPIDEVPHPLMQRTRELLAGTRAKLWFIHVNNTNAEIDAPDVAKEGLTVPM
jgi:pyrroloquinoline quinone biosynthesis protein B